MVGCLLVPILVRNDIQRLESVRAIAPVHHDLASRAAARLGRTEGRRNALRKKNLHSRVIRFL